MHAKPIFETIECPKCKTLERYCVDQRYRSNMERQTNVPLGIDHIFMCPKCNRTWVVGLIVKVGETGDELKEYGFSGRIMTALDRLRFPYLKEAKYMIVGDNRWYETY